MANANEWHGIGNITREIELRATPSGQSVCTIGFATNRRWTSKAGEKQEEVTFIDIDVWGKTAEFCDQYLGKGSPIYVKGRLKLDQWEQDGQKRQKLKVVAERVESLAKRANASDPLPAKAGSGEDDSTIPF